MQGATSVSLVDHTPPLNDEAVEDDASDRQDAPRRLTPDGRFWLGILAAVGLGAVVRFVYLFAAAPKTTAASTSTDGTVGGTVPATLSLTLGAPATFGAFVPGVENDYTATTTANVISTAGDATLSVSEPGRLTNGAFTLAEPLRVSFSKSTWTAPVSNDAVDVTFKQLIKRTDPLRTGSYSKTLTFTLSTTTP